MLQDTWRRCTACEVLFFCGRSRGRCGGTGAEHVPAMDAEYTLEFGPSAQPRSRDPRWRWCQRCESLFVFAPAAGLGFRAHGCVPRTSGARAGQPGVLCA